MALNISSISKWPASNLSSFGFPFLDLVFKALFLVAAYFRLFTNLTSEGVTR